MDGAKSTSVGRSRPVGRSQHGNGGSADFDDARLYRTYFKSTADPLFLVAITPDGRFYYEDINPAEESATGLSAEFVRGKEPSECLPSRTADDVMARYRQCAAAGTTMRYEHVLTLTDRTRVFETTLTPIRDSSGRIAQLFGACRDITDLE